MALHDATDGPNWKNNTTWLSDEPVGRWYGVTADPYGRVVELPLHDNGPTWPVPPQLGNLSSLWVMSLSDNELTGPIPPQLGNLSDLLHLWLDSNELAGPTPHTSPTSSTSNS